MTPLVALALGLLATGYAVWPIWRGGERGRLIDEVGEGEAPDLIARGASAARRWSEAAGELGKAPNGHLDPERFPK